MYFTCESRRGERGREGEGECEERGDSGSGWGEGKFVGVRYERGREGRREKGDGRVSR